MKDLKGYFYDNLNKALVFSVLILAIYLIVQIVLRGSLYLGFVLAVVPFLIVALFFILDRPFVSFLMLFTANYFVSGASRYINLAPGITMDAIFVSVILVIFLQNFKDNKIVDLKDSNNIVVAVVFFWLFYCTLQVFNPNSSSILAWMGNVRGISVYFFLTVFFSTIFIKSLEHFKKILFIWSFFIILAVLKGFIQKTIGFDYAELRWLDEGGRNTHIIHTGIRYFSFFTDAGNFGSGMSFSLVVFLISAFAFKSSPIRLYFIFVSAIAFYGMVISGTRGSLIVPLAGFSIYTLLSKNIRAIVMASLFVVVTVWFLNFTYIGHGNVYIRRMRSAFNPDDASLQVRLENQRVLRSYMINHPLGVGIGMKRGNAVNYVPHPVLSKIPHDSWYVLLWVELGIVGMIIYIIMLIYFFVYGSYLVMFKLQNRELRFIVASLVCALFGVSLAAYSLEIFGQFPNSILIYISISVIFLSPKFDKQLLAIDVNK